MDNSSAYDVGYAFGAVIGCFLAILVPALFIFALIMAIVRKSRGWTIVTVILGVLGLGFLGVAAYFGVRQAAESAAEAKVPREFVSSDNLVAVTGPGSWTEQDLGSDVAGLQLANLFAEEYLIVISELKSDFPEEFDLEEFVDVASSGIIDSVTEADFSEMEPLAVGGCEGFQHELNGSIDGIRISYVNSFLEGKEHFHQILAWTLEERKERVLPILKEASLTFRETD